MELVFIRHGEGEHTLDIPRSLQICDPALTAEGVSQSKLLREQFPLTEEDILVISPLRRALQTADYWSSNVNCKKIVSPLVSPRIFPQVPSGKTLPCDEILSKRKIEEEFPGFDLQNEFPEEMWINGINTLPELQFNLQAKKFLNWCKRQENPKIYVVSHDGTITSYRELITGTRLTRDDFPKETGWFKINPFV
ncbi:histidine phosphatase family protein [Sutcliffiella horikoshii]|uniref:histidine phosphatase family protein n=1 Tax=Sutcliffiella horikoshii TaxID=79883 RepID=UPI00384D125D